VQSAIDGDDTTPDDPCCELRYIDVKQSRAIVTANYSYIFRAGDDVETAGGVDDLYTYTYDKQQFYDLNADPDQQINLIAEYESYRDDDSDGSLSSTITSFQSMMKDYVNATCPMDDNECAEPSYTFCTEIVSAKLWTSDLDEAESLFVEDYPDCNLGEYYYWLGSVRTICLMEVCCAEEVNGSAIFPGNYSAPSGYSSSLDEESAIPLNGAPVVVLNIGHNVKIVGMLLVMLVIGCLCGRVEEECTKPKMGWIQMTKLENVESEDESDVSDKAKECKVIGNEEERQGLAQQERL